MYSFTLGLTGTAATDLPLSTHPTQVLLPLQLRTNDFETSKLALTSHFPMQMQNEKEKKKRKAFQFSPSLSFSGRIVAAPLETKPAAQFWGENGLRDPGGCSALPKQTIQQTNNYTHELWTSYLK